MKTHPDVIQGSEEWLRMRSQYFCASEAAAMLGLSKQGTRTDLLLAKKYGIEKDVSGYVQRFLFDKGHEVEGRARTIAEAELGEELYPITGTIELDGLKLLASFDGLSVLEDVCWEHKLSNQDLAADVRADHVPDTHWPQLEHQLLVSGAAYVLFMVSDGTREGAEWLSYESDMERRNRIIAGWKQFAEDLKTFEPTADDQEPQGKSPDTLPALRIDVQGLVTRSNLPEFKSTALATIAAISTDLETDADFADAEKAVKWCKDVEQRLKAAKEHALSQTSTIEELFRTLDDIAERTRAKRLSLDKLIKARKTEIRVDIQREAIKALADHVKALDERIGKPYMPPEAAQAPFAQAIKNKRTIASLRDAVNTELAQAKIRANEAADRIQNNLRTLKEHSDGYKTLFSDAKDLVRKNPEDLLAIIKARIAEHQEEQRRADEEKKRREEEKKRREEGKRAATPVQEQTTGKAVQASEQNTPAAQQNTCLPQLDLPTETKLRPTDSELAYVIKQHFSVPMVTVVEWLRGIDFKALDTEVVLDWVADAYKWTGERSQLADITKDVEQRAANLYQSAHHADDPARHRKGMADADEMARKSRLLAEYVAKIR